jgi:hypothetical protein
MPKIQDLWVEVEKSLTEGTLSGFKIAILEAHKVLEAVLDSKGYIGGDIERKLFWAGYSLKDKNGLGEALDKRKEILNKFEYQMSDFEAKEIVRKYKVAIDKVSQGPKFTIKERAKMVFETYFSPKSYFFWRNLAIFFGFFAIINLLAKTSAGLVFVEWLVSLATFLVSWQFLVLIAVIAVMIFIGALYLEKKSKVVIKDSQEN